MSTNSKIEWCEHTANLWHGCTKVHAGCDNCYAETMTKRWGREIWGNDAPRLEIASVWNDLRKQQNAAYKAGTMARVFVGSMMDIFEKPMPMIKHTDEFAMDHIGKVYGGSLQQVTTGVARDRLFADISAGLYPNLIFLFLTKRPGNINKYIPEEWKAKPPKNVMFGTSPCDQKTFDTLVPQLLQAPGKKFLSIEPLLGRVDLLFTTPIFFTRGGETKFYYFQVGQNMVSGIDWIIVGGESGPKARPMDPSWVRALKAQAYLAEIPFFFKQWGEHGPAYPGSLEVIKVGKHAAGRELDGGTYSSFPWEAFSISQTIKL